MSATYHEKENTIRFEQSLDGRAAVHARAVIEATSPDVEVVLDFSRVRNITGDEAAHGGTVRVPVPVFVRCDACGGNGYEWLLPCAACGRRGIVEVERRVPIAIPPMARSGTLIEAPLDALGIHNFYLRVHVSVAG